MLHHRIKENISVVPNAAPTPLFIYLRKTFSRCLSYTLTLVCTEIHGVEAHYLEPSIMRVESNIIYLWRIILQSQEYLEAMYFYFLLIIISRCVVVVP